VAREKILIVEDDALIAYSMRLALERNGYTLLDPVATGEEALKSALENKPDFALVDIRLAGKMDGITAGERMRADGHMAVIYLTGYSRDSRLPPDAVCLSKPVEIPVLLRMIENLLNAGSME
jgi:CheY-like chemotaxis protein